MMRFLIKNFSLGAFILLSTFYVSAQPLAPVLTVNTSGLNVSLSWSTVSSAKGYRLFYAPYPYQGAASIESIDLQDQTSFSIQLWQDASYYVAIKAYDSVGQLSEYSNIGFVQIKDRGEAYRDFWKLTTKQIENHQFTTDEFLYLQKPDLTNCHAGKLNQGAVDRHLLTYNHIRSLHSLSPLSYDDDNEEQTQQAALIQKANDFLMHQPPNHSLCFSNLGLEGSQTSNLSLVRDNNDPAFDLIGLIDDAFNISNVSAVGHRRHLLNPFSSYTSYGQVFGASAIKVFNFEDKPQVKNQQIPAYIAFPYLRYPYVFFSDKTSNHLTPWSFSIIENPNSLFDNDHDYFSKSVISVKQKDNNQSLPIINVHSDNDFLGVPNILSWFVEDWQYDTWYTVQIKNIHYESGQSKNIQYDVYIDYKNFFNVDYPLENQDQQSAQEISGTLANTNDMDSYPVNLAGQTFISGTSQFSNMAFFIQIYDSEKKLVISNDENFSHNFPQGLYTLVVSNCFNQSCYNDFKQYSINISLQ